MPEVAVMEYTTQQYKLLPQVAALYSNLFAVDALEKKYRKFLEKMETGDISELPEVRTKLFELCKILTVVDMLPKSKRSIKLTF